MEPRQAFPLKGGGIGLKECRRGGEKKEGEITGGWEGYGCEQSSGKFIVISRLCCIPSTCEAPLTTLLFMGYKQQANNCLLAPHTHTHAHTPLLTH